MMMELFCEHLEWLTDAVNATLSFTAGILDEEQKNTRPIGDIKTKSKAEECRSAAQLNANV